MGEEQGDGSGQIPVFAGKSSTASQPVSHRWVVWVCLVVLVAAVAGALWYASWQKRYGARQKSMAARPSSTDLHAAPKPRLYNIQHTLAKLPVGMPVEQNAPVVEDISGTILGASSTVSTLEFISSKPAGENVALYKSWLQDNAWKNITSTSTSSTEVLLVASQGKDTVNISTYSPPSGKVYITITNYSNE